MSANICELVEEMNEYLPKHGFGKIVLKNEYVTITESEVIMKLPLTLTVKIPKESLGSDDAVRQAISRAVSVNK